MKQLFLTIILLASFGASSQTIKEANRWFDSYEYAKAATIYEQVIPATIEDYQRWCYAYFITGEYKKCMPLADSIVRRIDTPSFFYYAHGYSAMALGDYPTALESFQEYRKLDDEFGVDMLIESCRQIPTWEKEEFISIRLEGFNSDKSDFSGEQFKDGYIEFHESGVDSLKGSIVGGSFEKAELLLTRPFRQAANEILTLFTFPDSLGDASITSFTYDENTNEVFFTVSRHLEQNELKRAPHIYQGILEGNAVLDIQPWKYAGYEDTSSTAHATINESGTMLVFSKLGANTLSSDLYFSKRHNDSWSIPTPMNDLNTDFDEMYPLFMGDTLLSFSSEGRPGYGGLDIYLARMTGDLVEEIIHPKSPVNSFQDDFNFIYYSADSARFSSNRHGGKGDDDIYFIKYRDYLELEEVIAVEHVNIEFLHTFSYNKDKLNISFGDYKRFVKSIEEQLDEGRSTITIKITSSASNVPTRRFASNQELSTMRAQNVKYDLIEHFEGKEEYKGRVNVVIESSVVDGPKFENDSRNKEKYEPFQFVRIITE